MGPRPSWCGGNNVWDARQNLCLNWQGAPVNQPEGGGSDPEAVTAKPDDCDCAGTAYEKGHKCYKPCGGNEGSGVSGDDHAWYVREIQSRPDVFDTGIDEGQWIAWRKFWDDGSKSFRSENVDHDGNAIGGTGFAKPVDCPEGTTKFNINQCLPLDDQRIISAWSTQPKGTGKAATGTGTGKGTGGDVAKTSRDLAVSQIPYTGEELHDVLANFFNYRAGIFGTNDQNLSGATSRTPKGEDIKAYDLPGGGIWWGEGKGLADALAPFGSLYDSSKKSTAVTMASPLTPKVTPTPHTCPAGYKWNASLGACMPEVTGQPAQKPVEFEGPLSAALNKQQITA